MKYILDSAIDKYNDNSIDNGVERFGTGFIQGITLKINQILIYILIQKKL